MSSISIHNRCVTRVVARYSQSLSNSPLFARSNRAGSVLSPCCVALRTPWHVLQMVIRSAPSRSAIARVKPLSASLKSGFCSLSTPAPVQGASLNSTSSKPRASATLCVETYSSGHAPLETQPGQNATFIYCSPASLFESAAQLIEDVFHAFQAGYFFVEHRRQFAGAQ